jgi:hypothetical protein
MASRLRVCLASVLPFFLGAHNLSAQLDDVWLGTWKVNLAKSTYSPGVLRRAPLWPSGSASAVVSSRQRVVGWMSRAPVRWVVVTRLDGKDAPISGAAAGTTRAFKRLDARSYEFVTNVDGKVVTTTRAVLSSDGKSRTLTSTGVNPQEQHMNEAVVWDKQ